jgi:hypothetical protein
MSADDERVRELAERVMAAADETRPASTEEQRALIISVLGDEPVEILPRVAREMRRLSLARRVRAETEAAWAEEMADELRARAPEGAEDLPIGMFMRPDEVQELAWCVWRRVAPGDPGPPPELAPPGTARRN